MAYILLPFTCTYLISFDGLGEIATACGIVLIIEASLLFWKKLPLQQLYRLLLIGATFAVGTWSFVLAYIASRNILICAGVPDASNDLIQHSEESYHTLTMFQAITSSTLAATIIFVLIGIFVFLHHSKPNV